MRNSSQKVGSIPSTQSAPTSVGSVSCGVGLRMSGDVGLRVNGKTHWWTTGYDTVAIDLNVRVGCQRSGRPTTTGHDRGHCSLRNGSAKLPGVLSRWTHERAFAFVTLTRAGGGGGAAAVVVAVGYLRTAAALDSMRMFCS